MGRNLRILPKRPQGEDPASLAGWMFADLLLALTVIFLATISFIPAIANGTSSTGAVASFSIQQNTIALSQVDEKTVTAAMEQYAKVNHLPKSFKVGSMSVLGGFNPTKQQPDAGVATALKFATKISQLSLPYFQGTATQIGSSAVVSDGHVVLNLNLNG